MKSENFSRNFEFALQKTKFKIIVLKFSNCKEIKENFLN